MNFLVRKILGKHFSPAEWANFLVKETAESAGKVFNDSQFQKLARVQEFDEEERNRIFNEVQVTGLVYLILLIENKLRYMADERISHWREVAQAIPAVYCAWLAELGIAQEFVDIWKKLIDLRLSEYQEEFFGTKEVLEKRLADELEGRQEEVKDAFYRLETVAVASMLHITRGKAKPDDPLKRHLMTWLGVLEANTSKNIE